MVDIQVKLSTLAELDNDPALIPGWGPVIADIARQVAHDQKANPAWKWSVTDETGSCCTTATPAADPRPPKTPSSEPATAPAAPPAAAAAPPTCEIDHRKEWAKGGPSHRGNLDARCEHHHRLRGQPSHTITRTKQRHPTGPHPTAAATTSAPTRTSSSPPMTSRPTPHYPPMWRKSLLYRLR